METENMNPEDIFHKAIEIVDTTEREAYLNKACKENEKLQADVEELLKAHEQAGDFLEVPAIGPNATLENSPLTEGPGTKIGRYELLELIGEGGMGLVYLAEQKDPVKRRVALKIVKPGMDTKQVIARFEAERQALAMLDHPNIAHVFDAGTTEAGLPYFVMEYVKGMSITAYCDEHKLNIEQRLRLFEHVCEGIHHAHQKGIIHRDIKPSNILVSVHGDRAVPKIIDFGIAKATASSLTDKTVFTSQGQLLGTPEYMSPEQVDLAIQDIDTRSDIYSLGVVLYELLAGVLPFERESLARLGFAEVQRTIRELEPASPSVRLTNLGEKGKTIAASRGTQLVPLARRLHRELEWIPLKAMRKDRCRRYRSASEMADDVRNYLTGLPLIAGPETAVYRIKKFVHKHAGSVATVVLVAAAIILGLIVSTAMYFRAEDARQKEVIARTEAEQATKKEAVARAEAEQAKEKETVARTQAEQAKNAEQEQRKLAEDRAEKLRRTLYVNSIQLADAKYYQGNIRRVQELLDACPNDLRGWEWYRLNYVSDQSLMTLRGHTSWVFCVAVSPDGKRIVSGGIDRTIKIWDVETGVDLKTFRGHLDAVDSVVFSPDGKRIVSGSWDKTIKIWDAESGAEVMTLRMDGRVESVSISPDGKHIASGGRDHTIKLWDAETGEASITLTGHTDNITSLTFSPDGKKLVSGSNDKTIKIWDVGTGTETMTIRGHRDEVCAVKFSPDGERIISGSSDRTIKVWDAATGVELMTLRGHEGDIRSIAVSPDNKYIASGSIDNTIKVWEIASGENVLTLRGHEHWVLSIAFTPDGTEIVSSGGWGDATIKIWDITGNRELTKLAGHDSSISSIAFSPDGSRLISGSQNGMVKLWDTRSCSEAMTLRNRQEEFYIYHVAFSPDGRYVAAGGFAQTFKTWDAATGAEMMTFLGHQGSIDTVAFSPDGKHIASGSRDKTIKVWDLSSGKEVITLKGHEYGVVCVAFSPDGQFIASGGSGATLKVWDWQSERECLTLRGQRGIILSVGFSLDGKRIVSACQGDNTVKVWDAITGAEIMTLKHSDVVISASFSPDGKRIVSGCRDRAARVWDATTGAELLTLRVESGVTTVAFDPEGETIVAGTFDGPVVLWESDTRTGRYQTGIASEVARQLVDELYQKCSNYYEVINKLQADTGLDQTIRKIALQIANSRMEKLPRKHGLYELIEGISAGILNGQSWRIVRLPDGNEAAYREALSKAQKAASLRPDDWMILDTLGGAQYRVGAYEDALETLARAERIRLSLFDSPCWDNLAFTAMALHRLGRADEAISILEQLRTLLKDERFADDIEVQDLLAEAEKLIAGQEP